MKKITVLALAFCLAGAAYAGCGVKVDVTGKLTKFDAEKKELTVASGKADAPEEKKITLEATAAVKDDKGAEVKIEDLVGKSVSVSTDKHTKKGESVTLAAQ
jgi:ABC-type glycerol-3-phosphate transport system substrate-binding protein